MAPRTKHWWRIDLYEPDEMLSDRTHGLPFRRIEFRATGQAHAATGKHRKMIQERLAKIGYRLMGTLERGSLKPRGEWEWRAGLWLAQQKPGKDISGRVSQMERTFLIGPGPDQPVPKARGVNVTEWPRGRPNPKPLTEGEKDTILRLALDGVSRIDIAARTGRGPGAIRRFLATQAVRPAPENKVVLDQAMDLYAGTTMSLEEIARATGVNMGGLACEARKRGLQSRTERDRLLSVLLGYAAGGDPKEIARAMGVTTASVLKAVESAGVLQERPLTGIDWAVNLWLHSNLGDGPIHRLTGVSDPRWEARKMGFDARDPSAPTVLPLLERQRQRVEGKRAEQEKEDEGRAVLRRKLATVARGEKVASPRPPHRLARTGRKATKRERRKLLNKLLRI